MSFSNAWGSLREGGDGHLSWIMGVGLNSPGTHLKMMLSLKLLYTCFCNMALPENQCQAFCYNFFRSSGRALLKLHLGGMF